MEYVDVQIRVPKKMQDRLEELGAMCDLTGEQMASAIFVLSAHIPPKAEETEETHL